ncbi:MAG TPA: sigma 54-interacting transcriptional regulator [Gammaproteobacteria bacterium]|nr:sigma 54-interacting transcriptional regulator [Gammaproteobacteria bacterium]
MPDSSSASAPLSPVGFLQTFIVQSVKAASQVGQLGEDDRHRYIEHLGLAAASCLESACRARQELPPGAPLDHGQYADMIVGIKNRIGGSFARASSPAGSVRVVSYGCPFGEAVREAPELCRMTSSVFGAIAARNFGYAKVELRKRIATNDGMCEVCVYTDPDAARDQPGDEYHLQDDGIRSRLTLADDARLQQKLRDAWCAQATGPSVASERPGRIVAESPAMRAALRAAEIVASTDASVLITGETGTGKEIIARTVHALSNRCARPFLAINCGAIPEGLIESELFGHERGAFTGAYHVHHGYFERGAGGTLFLDEVNALPLAAQVRLLRVLQEREFDRVGGSKALRTDVRVIAAANQDITALMRSGRFRHDLYYRLNVIPIDLPPLRARPDDLSALVGHLLARLADKYDCATKMLSPRAWHQVVTYDWPGNIRELENLLERAFLFTTGTVIDSVVEPDAGESEAAAPSLRELRRRAADAAESRAIHESLSRCAGQVREVARELGVTPRAIHQKLKSHGIAVAKYRR